MSLFETIRGLLTGRDDGTDPRGDDGTATPREDATDVQADDANGLSEPTGGADGPAGSGEAEGPGDADPESNDVEDARARDVESTAGSPSPPPERFPEEAAQLVDFWPEFDFDYSRASLVRLDEFLASQFDPSRFRNATFGGTADDSRLFTGLVIQLGSYYGEVLVRTAGATWTETGAFGWVVALPGATGELDGTDEQPTGRRPLVWPALDVARDCIRGEGSFATSFDAVVAFLEIGTATATDDSGIPGEPVDIGGPLAGVEEPERLADRAAGLADDYPWFDLDYSLASLVAVDRIVGTELRDGGTPVEGYSDGEVAGVLGTLGAYVGETLVRGADGEWTRAPNRSDTGASSSRRTWTVRVPTGDDADADRTAHVDPVRVAAASLHTGGSVVRLCEGALRRRISVRGPSGPPGVDPGAAGASLDAPATTGRGDGTADGAVGDPGEELTVAGQAEALAAANPAFDLDFTPESLARLDDLVEEAHADEFVDVDPGDLDESARLVSTALPYACYFGETVRRSQEDAGWADRVERGDDDGGGGADGDVEERGDGDGDGEGTGPTRGEDRFTVAVPGEDGAVGVDALRTAATCLAGNATFGGTYRALLDARREQN